MTSTEKTDQDILEKLEELTPSLTGAQQKVALFILDNSMDAIFMPIEKMAMAVGTSTNTIVRLTLALGYSGYSDFIQDLQILIKRKIMPSNRLEANFEKYQGDNLLNRCYEQNLNNLKNTYSKQNQESLEQCVNALLNASHIYSCGSRASYAMAYYFNYQCFRLRGNSSFLNSEGIILPEQINAIGEEDVVLVIALPRYPAKAITIAKYAKARGAFVIGITDDRKSPLNKYSNYSLLCTCKSIGFHNSTIGVAMLIDYLLIALSFKDEEVVKKRLDSIESILSDPSLVIYH